MYTTFAVIYDYTVLQMPIVFIFDLSRKEHRRHHKLATHFVPATTTHNTTQSHSMTTVHTNCLEISKKYARLWVEFKFYYTHRKRMLTLFCLFLLASLLLVELVIQYPFYLVTISSINHVWYGISSKCQCDID